MSDDWRVEDDIPFGQHSSKRKLEPNKEPSKKTVEPRKEPSCFFVFLDGQCGEGPSFRFPIGRS